MEKEVIICGLTQDQIDSLKKKHGAVFHQKIKDPKTDQTYNAIYKEPDETVLSAFQAVSKSDDVKGALIMFDNCCLACDDEVRKRLPLKLQVVKAISESMTQLESEVKNL